MSGGWCSTIPLSLGFPICKAEMPLGDVLGLSKRTGAQSSGRQVAGASWTTRMQFCGVPQRTVLTACGSSASPRRGVLQGTAGSGRLGCAAGQDLTGIAHPRQLKTDILLSSRRCYGCFPLFHLRFAGLSSDIIWSDVPEKCGLLPVGRPARLGAVRATRCGSGGLVQTRFCPHLPQAPNIRPL